MAICIWSVFGRGLKLTQTFVRQSTANICSPCALSVLLQQVACKSYKTHQATHVPNYRRTRAEVAQALRRKQNFLHSDFVDEHRYSQLQKGTENIKHETGITAPREYRYVMPEFLPWPKWEYRDRVMEKLERQDMLRRRAVIEIPEFYVGSIMSVSVSDPHAPGNKNRFLGICIDRGGNGLKAYFVIRNVVEGLGVEVMYHMYSPTILSIQVVRLEKRLDDKLYFLRDAMPEYSTFSFDMDLTTLPRGAKVPVNTEKVKMRPSRWWEVRWEMYDFQGIEPFELSDGRIKRLAREHKPFHPNDLMREYRGKINEDEEEIIMAEVYKSNKIIEERRKGTRTILKKKK